jgi:transcription elongation factor Elf1
MIIKKVHCPRCNKKIEVIVGKKTNPGTIVKCPNCKHTFKLASKKLKRLIEFLTEQLRKVK